MGKDRGRGNRFFNIMSLIMVVFMTITAVFHHINVSFKQETCPRARKEGPGGLGA